ncbi:MAG TPA: MASE1 domain-containing protein [Longimicrobiales bacterium]
MFAKSLAARVLLAAGLYLVAVRLGLLLGPIEQTAMTFRPAAGVGLAAVLLWGNGVWPGIFVAQLAADVVSGAPGAAALASAAGNAVGALAGGYVIRRIAGPDSRFERLRDMLALLIVPVGSTALIPTIGLAGHALAGLVPWDRLHTLWGAWWLGDFAGTIVAAPALLVWADQPRPWLRAGARLEFGILIASLVAVLVAAFGDVLPLGRAAYALAHVAIPCVIWAVLRFRQHGAVTTVVLVAAIVTWQTLHGHGPFARAGASESGIHLQAFLVVLSVGSQLLAAATAERERAEAELRFQKSLLEAQSEGAIDGILVAADDGTVRTWNRQLLDMWEIAGDPARMSADACLEHISARVADPETFRGRVAHLNAHPEARGSGEITLLDGRTFEWYATPIHGPGGVRYGRGWFFRDITERRRLEEQLRQSQKMEAIGRLAGGIAHDFNNLLTAIHGHTRLLLEDLRPDDPVRADLEEIREASVRAASLTRQLLAFGRKQVHQPRVIDPNAVVRETTRMLRRLIGEDIELQASLEPALGHVRVDPGQLQQVLLNLALNARDAMPAGGRITIATANVDDASACAAAADAGGWPGGWIVLAVSDTGTGMRPEVRERIFEPFFTTKAPGKGTGLGLSTVYGIVQQCNGCIEVDSEVGRGTTVRVYLPRVAVPIDQPEAAAPARDLHGAGRAVLLVEDDPAVRSLARRILERKGYRVLEAASGADAITRFSQSAHEIDLLLTDLIMPGMSGRELAARFRAVRPGLAVVFMSGYADDESILDDALQDPATFVSKPFTPETLAQVVHDALRRRAAAVDG